MPVPGETLGNLSLWADTPQQCSERQYPIPDSCLNSGPRAQAQNNHPPMTMTSQPGEQWPGFWAAGTSCAHSEAHPGPTMTLILASTPLYSLEVS